MFRRISRIVSGDSFSTCQSFHSDIPCIGKHSYSFPCTEEVLASRIAPFVQQKTVPLSPSVIQQTQQIHAQLTVNGLQVGILGTRVLGIYLMCNNYFDAKKLFCRLQLCYAAPWNWMIRGFTVMGHCEYAVLFYFKMLAFGTRPDKYTFPFLIKACGGLQAVGLVKHVHRVIKDLNFELDVYVGSALIKFYSQNECLDSARDLFDRLPQKDIVLWNVMFDCYLKCKDLSDDVIGLYAEMRKGDVDPNYVTYTSILCLCGLKSMAAFGAQVHGSVVRCGLEMYSSVANTLVSMYTKCGCLSDAQKMFDLVTQADVITWNAMIGGYVQNGFMNDALNLFGRMISSAVTPDSITFASLLPSVSEFGCLNQGKEIHGFIIRHGVLLDLHLKNALIDMYFKSKNVKMACKVYDQSSAADIVICTAMISGFVLNGMNADALKTFRWLLDMKMRPNAVTLASVLPVCASLSALKLGKELHGSIIRKGLEERCYVGSALTDMYAKCGSLDLCRHVFLRMPERDSICWNSIITNFCQNGKPEVAKDLFRLMGIEGVKYDCVTISAALSACANLSTLHHGKEIHGFILRGGYNFDVFANSAVIDMYAKCGNLEFAQRAFNSMEFRNEVSWNSIIAAYGNHGHLNQCLTLFHNMQDQGFQPDHVTFLAVISACGHAGEVEYGKSFFNAMTQEYGITARMEHYACLIDLLGRAGCLKEAFQVIETMPSSPDAGIWGTILGACRMHGDVELAEVASEHLLQLDPENSGYYVLLSNLHADSGTWTKVDQIRNFMKERGVQKIRGYSWIDVNNAANVFSAADESHPQASQIYLLLNNLLLELQYEGDVLETHTSSVVFMIEN